MKNFNPIATDYSHVISSLPKEYIYLMVSKFNVKQSSRVLDIGCGSGTLTFLLSKYVNEIEAIDCSSNMIGMAKAKDYQNKINWICSDISRLVLPNSYYQLIVSYEAFHLFPSQEMVEANIYTSLLKNGYFAIGYSVYCWEEKANKLIGDVLSEYKIHGFTPYFQSCSEYHSIFNNGWNIDAVTSQERWESKQIAKFIVSTSLFLNESKSTRFKIEQDLETELSSNIGETIIGPSSYYLKYYRKNDK